LISSSSIHSFIIIIFVTVGGKVGRKGWGDEFLKVLISGLIHSTGLYKLKQLHYADAQLTCHGFYAIVSYLVCDKIQLQELNISRNSIQNLKTKNDFISAIRMNKSLIKLFIRECGFKNHDLNLCKDVINSNYRYYCYHRDQCWLDNDNININNDIKNNKDHNYDNDYNDHPISNNLFQQSTSSDYSSSMNNNDINDIESDIYSIFQNRPTSNGSINNNNYDNNSNNNNSTSSNFYRIDPEIRYPVLNRGITLPEVLNYNFYRSFSWMELSSLAECAALGFNESRHSYHKVSKMVR